MSEFNFKSQICTSREQSERLLSLGLKKETADIRGVEGIEHTPTYAWSLHRLIEMCDVVIRVFKKRVSLSSGEGFNAEETLYDNLINCIEWLIKEGYFPKEYLDNQDEIDEHCKGVLEYLDYIRGEEE